MLAALEADRLGPDQADTVRRLATQGLGVEVVVGRAGTGKTYTMNTVRQVFEAAGLSSDRRLHHRHARHANCTTAPGSSRSRSPASRSTRTIEADHVVVIDEAAWSAPSTSTRLVTRARQAGAKVIVVGDHHQLPEINAGGGFTAVLGAVGDRRVRADDQPTATPRMGTRCARPPPRRRRRRRSGRRTSTTTASCSANTQPTSKQHAVADWCDGLPRRIERAPARRHRTPKPTSSTTSPADACTAAGIPHRPLDRHRRPTIPGR